jgi:hypothetical protein
MMLYSFTKQIVLLQLVWDQIIMSHIPSNTFPPSLERSLHSSLFEKGKQLLDLVIMQGIASKDFYKYLGKKNPWL